MTHESQNLLAALLFAVIVSLVGWDLLSDAGSGAGLLHLGAEGTAVLVAAAGSAWFLRRALSERAQLAHWRDQAEALLGGMGRTIREAFETWSLTQAEQEVALLLLKGLSFKEIAGVRETTERTAREQARAVYRKAGVAGRAELSAWFIEDLLPPPSQPSAPRPAQDAP